HHLLAPRLGQLGADDTRRDVGDTAGRIGHQDMDGLGGIVLRLRGGGAQNHKRNNDTDEPSHGDPPSAWGSTLPDRQRSWQAAALPQPHTSLATALSCQRRSIRCEKSDSAKKMTIPLIESRSSAANMRGMLRR